MEVYLIRHGQTDGNLAKRHQREHSSLTALGKLQAKAAATEMAQRKPTHLYVSSRRRALETGHALGQVTGLVPETSELFSELCRPWNLYGHFHFSLRSVWFMMRWYFGWYGGTDCGEGGESVQAFVRRIHQAATLLESLPADARVVVVSHSVFITFFIAATVQKSQFRWWQAPILFYRLFRIKNGSITKLMVTNGQWSRASGATLA